MRAGVFLFIFIFVSQLQAQETCVSTYDRILNDGQMKISIAYGYNDLSDEGVDITMDEIASDTFVYKLTQSCTNEENLCGFKMNSSTADKTYRKLSKTSVIRGKTITIDIEVIYSSYSFVNSENKNLYKSEQAEQTELAEDFFANALANSDVVFYSGHSRDGGGPDFSPPQEYKSGGVNYNWYYKNRPGVKKLKNWMSESEKHPVILGLFSCASKLHFKKTLQKHMPQTELILSRRVIPSIYTKQALNISLNNLLAGRCSEDIKEELHPLSFEWLLSNSSKGT